MNQYLRAIGFKGLDSKKKLKKIVSQVINESTQTQYTEYPGEADCILVECCKDFGEDIGIAAVGQFDENNQYIFDYYYPYLKGRNISTAEEVSVERHSSRESYAAVCDDYRLGVTLISYLQNMITFLKRKEKTAVGIEGSTLILSALALSGNIVLPIKKSAKEKVEKSQFLKNRNELIAQAKQGDEEAIEHLTLDDMDTYTAISEKIATEDILTLVDTYFMPYGIDCDQYSILAEIISVETIVNNLTKEEIFRMEVNCNELIFDLCINKDDLLGIPEPGRRFKGIIWMQGKVNFP